LSFSVNLAPFLTLSFPAAIHFQQDVLSYTGPRAMGPTNHGLQFPKLQSKINLSSFKIDLLSYFDTVMES
jgi:hypothetical protein